MKKIVASLLILMIVGSLTACSNKTVNDEANVEVNAALESEKIVSPSYGLEENKIESNVWTSNYLAALGDNVYYICSDSENYYVNCFNSENLTDKVILSSKDKILCDIAVDSEGTVFILATSNNEDGVYEIIKADLDGKNIESYALTKLGMEDGWVPKQIECWNGNLFILGNDYLISTEIDSEIKKLQSLSVQPGTQFSCMNDGELVLAYNKENKYYVRLYSSEKLEPIYTVAFNMPFLDISSGTSWDIFLSNNNALYGYRFESNEFKKLFSWNGVGILRGSVVESQEKLVCSGRTSFDKQSPLLVLKPIEVNQENSGVIRFATTDPNGIDFRVQEAIRAWNSSNPQCPIEIIDYSVYGGTDNTMSATKLMADIVSGNMPDIYDFSMTSIDTIPSSAQFARRGMLENLYPYIDNDPELSRSDFIPGVINALEINGGLYEVVPAFSLVTTFAASSAVGPEENWTYDNLNSIVENSDFFDSIFDKHHDRMWMLGNIIDASGEKLVNWTEGKCYFESDYFRNLLETTKKMPEIGSEMETPLLSEEISTSTGLLYYVNANDVWMASTGPQAFNEDYCFPGLPEVGSAVYPLCSYGISAYSSNKDLCWKFLRQFLTEEYKLKFFITTRLDGLREQINNTWEGFGDIRQYHPYGLEAMNKLADIIIDIDTVVRHDPQIWQIVHSEAEAYFAGGQSVEETMKQIQSRASIYMAEQCG